MENYSVLMTVYKNDCPEYLEQSIDSMLNQTYITNDYVIVCDGPITEPYTAYMQGGLTYDSGKIGIMIAIENMLGKDEKTSF